MRNIEYRAWDIQRKGMVTILDSAEGRVYLKALTHISNDFFIPMQFTGRLNAKGNKVFEGDLLRVGDDAFIGLVLFDDEALVWSCDVYTIDGEKVERMTLARFVYSRELAIRGGLEVIGNIYEHPHLIKGDG